MISTEILNDWGSEVHLHDLSIYFYANVLTWLHVWLFLHLIAVQAMSRCLTKRWQDTAMCQNLIGGGGIGFCARRGQKAS